MNTFKWQFIYLKARDMYPATSVKVSICITGQSGATYEYESSIFNEVHVFAFFKLSQHVELKITTYSMHMNISCISSKVKDAYAYAFKDKFQAAVSHSAPSYPTTASPLWKPEMAETVCRVFGEVEGVIRMSHP